MSFTYDLDKSLDYLIHTHNQQYRQEMSVVVHNMFGGRFDQEIGCLHTLFKYIHEFKRIVGISDGNTSEILIPGRHRIKLCQYERHKQHCGFFPLHGTVNSVTTHGLAYDVTNRRCGWLDGETMSYCNVIENDEVEIETDGYLVWTTEFLVQPPEKLK